jgi:hypothetical protein
LAKFDPKFTIVAKLTDYLLISYLKLISFLLIAIVIGGCCSLVCFTQYKFAHYKNYVPTKTSVQFQTPRFQIDDAQAHQKWEEISGRSPST